MENDVTLEVGGTLIQIGENKFPDPCQSKTTKCPTGMECTVQYIPRLLDVPVAHCVESNSTTTEGKNISWLHGMLCSAIIHEGAICS